MRGPATAPGVVWGLALLLTAGCAEHGAMPTRPSPSSGDDGDWRKIYPAVSNQDLHAVWGMDADDMWAVGDAGTILHYDGRAVRSVPSAATGRLVAIDGCARDEAWAVSAYGSVVHWDGRRWQLVHDLASAVETICNPAPGEVLVGGRRFPSPDAGPVVWRLAGDRWTVTTFPELAPNDRIHHIWTPGPDLPTMSASNANLFRFDGQHWHLSASVVRFLGAAADLVVARDHTSDETSYVTSLYRLRSDGSLELRCSPLVGIAVLASSRHTLLVQDQDRLLRMDDCIPNQVFGSMDRIRALATPILSGRDGSHVFAVGERASFHRLTWRSDRTMSSERLLPAVENLAVSGIVGDGRDLYIRDDWRNVFHRRGGVWHNTHAPFMVAGMWNLRDGTVVISSVDYEALRLAVLRPGETWQQLPAHDRRGDFWWIDENLRPCALTRDDATSAWELWELAEGVWSPICELLDVLEEELDEPRIYPIDLAGFAADDLYLLAELGTSAALRLLHFDGDRLRRLLPGQVWDPRAIHAGVHTGRLYVAGFDTEHGVFSAFLQDGELTLLESEFDYQTPTIREYAADLVLAQSNDRLFLLVDRRWEEIARPKNRPVGAFWAHPDQGLFVVTQDRTVYHRELAGVAP